MEDGGRTQKRTHGNVALAVSDGEMELTRTCCFEFNRMLRADSKRVLLSTFCFYFMVAGFTYWSLHPVVDKYDVFHKWSKNNHSLQRSALM